MKRRCARWLRTVANRLDPQPLFAFTFHPSTATTGIPYHCHKPSKR